jgi:hypothetical protein
MATIDIDELSVMLEAFGVDEVIEHIAMYCRERADSFEDGDNEEFARQWRVRGNGVMQALRFYQAFVKERRA